MSKPENLTPVQTSSAPRAKAPPDQSAERPSFNVSTLTVVLVLGFVVDRLFERQIQLEEPAATRGEFAIARSG